MQESGNGPIYAHSRSAMLLKREALRLANHANNQIRAGNQPADQAARSVLWVAHHEEKKKWEAWEAGWKNRITDEERELLRFTNELRIDEVKRAGANMHVGWEEIAIDDLVKSANRSHPAHGVHVFAPPGTPLPKARRPAYYFEQENGKEEVTALCERYLKFLAKAVEEFERST